MNESTHADEHGHEHKSALPSYINTPTSIGLGFLVILALLNFWHVLEESSFDLTTIGWVVLALVLGVTIGRLLAQHLSICTHAHFDNPKDISFILIVVFGSLVHTVFDGSVIHEGFGSSLSEGMIALIAIIGHEIVRTGILYKVLRTMSFPKLWSIISVFGVSVIGIASGFFISSVLSLERFEDIAHIVSGGLFIAVSVDLYYYLKYHHGTLKKGYLLIGVIVAFFLQFLHIEH